jgi:hypothetical protein
MQYNEERMRRLVYCKICKNVFEVKELNPRCIMCMTDMVTVVNSLITGERITGEPTNERSFRI